MHRSFFQCYPRLFVRLYLKYKFNAYCEKSDPKLFPLDSISKCRVFTSLLFFVQNIVIYYVRFSVCPYLHLLLAIISAKFKNKTKISNFRRNKTKRFRTG